MKFPFVEEYIQDIAAVSIRYEMKMQWVLTMEQYWFDQSHNSSCFLISCTNYGNVKDLKVSNRYYYKTRSMLLYNSFIWIIIHLIWIQGIFNIIESINDFRYCNCSCRYVPALYSCTSFTLAKFKVGSLFLARQVRDYETTVEQVHKTGLTIFRSMCGSVKLIMYSKTYKNMLQCIN